MPLGRPWRRRRPDQVVLHATRVMVVVEQGDLNQFDAVLLPDGLVTEQWATVTCAGCGRTAQVPASLLGDLPAGTFPLCPTCQQGLS